MPLFLLGRRIFYNRCQQILEIMYPGREIEIGIDLIWQYNTSDIPGAVVSEALNDGDNINRHCMNLLMEEPKEAASD